MGHGAWGMGHGAWGMGHGAWGWDMGRGTWDTGLGSHIATTAWRGAGSCGPSNQADQRQSAKRCARAETHVGCLGPRVPPTEPWSCVLPACVSGTARNGPATRGLSIRLTSPVPAGLPQQPCESEQLVALVGDAEVLTQQDARGEERRGDAVVAGAERRRGGAGSCGAARCRTNPSDAVDTGTEPARTRAGCRRWPGRASRARTSAAPCAGTIAFSRMRAGTTGWGSAPTNITRSSLVRRKRCGGSCLIDHNRVGCGRTRAARTDGTGGVSTQNASIKLKWRRSGLNDGRRVICWR